jgi:hypothetical protein
MSDYDESKVKGKGKGIANDKSYDDVARPTTTSMSASDTYFMQWQKNRNDEDKGKGKDVVNYGHWAGLKEANNKRKDAIKDKGKGKGNDESYDDIARPTTTSMSMCHTYFLQWQKNRNDEDKGKGKDNDTTEGSGAASSKDNCLK